MKYLSLFSGIGGFELGIQQAYEQLQTLCYEPKNAELQSKQDLPSNNSNKLQGATCIGFSEINKYAISIYQKHFPDHKNYGDITLIDETKLPDFDLLCGGFPCQSFSIAGKRRGFADTRGTMFFHIARILQAKKPRLLLLENVKGLLSHDEGKTFATIITTLDELGYDLQWQVLNSKDFGVPQNRERVFIVGHLRGTPRPQVFPLTADCQSDIVLPTLTARYYGAQANGGYIRNKQEQSVLVPEATRGGYSEATVGDSINLSQMNSKTRRGRVGKGVAQTVDTGMQQHTLTEDMKIRRLTPMECERLQGFPDGWTDSVSDTQRYKTLGNAVTVNVIEAIISKLL